MEFRILGPLEVYDGTLALPITGTRQRTLLATLLLNANEVVSTDRLVDAIWGERPPPTAATVVRIAVSRLRKVLGASRLQTLAPGYLIRVAREEVDLHRFEQLVENAERANSLEHTVASLREALQLWRGAPLADFAYAAWAQAPIARLNELRLSVCEKRIEAELALGRHADLVAELEALVTEHPLRERLQGQLMLALYRSGRQAEALGAFRVARHALVEELGIEPSPALRRLERAILAQDPGLEPAPAAPARSLLVASAAGRLDELLVLAEPLCAVRERRELVLARPLEAAEPLASESALLNSLRAEISKRGVSARVAAFVSSDPGKDAGRLAAELDADLLIIDSLLEAALLRAPCDVAVLSGEGALDPARPVLVPFGGGENEWAAVELGAWAAAALRVPLRLLGPEGGKRVRGDASRLLAAAGLAVQRLAGVNTEPVLASPGPEGVLGAAEDAGLVVLGLSQRWRSEGLGRSREEIVRSSPAQTLLVRCGVRPGGLAPRHSLTRFTWSIATHPQAPAGRPPTR